MPNLHDLVEEASNITSIINGVDYKYDYDHEDDDTIPSLLVFDTQEFAQFPSNKISMFGADDKAEAEFG